MIETLVAPEGENYPDRKRITRTMCEFLTNNGLLDERYELIDGVIILKMPKKPSHRITAWLIHTWLVAVFGDAFVQKEEPIALPGEQGEITEPEPEVAVTLAPTTDYVERNPGPQDVLLVVEISNTTLDFDLDTKALLYARVGIPEYWVMDINGRQIHRHRQPSRNGYGEVLVLRETENISPQNRAESVRVSELFPAPRP